MRAERASETSSSSLITVKTADCKNGGYKEFGFKNQGQCIAFVNRAAHDQ
jgi:hypothetical protein